VVRGVTHEVGVLTLLAVLLIPATYLLLWRTAFGLRLRSCGENPAAADSLGDALAVSRAGEAEAAARLAAGVRDPDRDVRRICVHLCGCLGDVAAGAAPGLADDLAALLDDDADAGRRKPVAALAAWALARLGDPRCVPYLRRALEAGGEPFGLFQSVFSAGVYLVDLPGVVEVARLVPGLAPDLLPALAGAL